MKSERIIFGPLAHFHISTQSLDLGASRGSLASKPKFVWVLEDDAGFSGDIAQFISAYQTLGALRKNWSNATPLENHRTFPPKTNASWSHDTPKIQGLYHLVGGLEHEFYDFPYVGNFIIPTDFHIFQRGRYTTNQSSFARLNRTKIGCNIGCKASTAGRC